MFSRNLRLNIILACFLWGLGGCHAEVEGGDGTADSKGGGPAWWLDLPPPPPGVDWPLVPLDEQRYVQAVAAIACINRDFDGPMEQKPDALNRVYFHHQTGPDPIAAYGAAVNKGDPDSAQRIGSLILDSIDRCPAP